MPLCGRRRHPKVQSSQTDSGLTSTGELQLHDWQCKKQIKLLSVLHFMSYLSLDYSLLILILHIVLSAHIKVKLTILVETRGPKTFSIYHILTLLHYFLPCASHNLPLHQNSLPLALWTVPSLEDIWCQLESSYNSRIF